MVIPQNRKDGNESNCTIVKFQLLFAIEKNRQLYLLSCFTSVTVLVDLSYTYACINAIVPQCIPITRRILLIKICLRPTE